MDKKEFNNLDAKKRINIIKKYCNNNMMQLLKVSSVDNVVKVIDLYDGKIKEYTYNDFIDKVVEYFKNYFNAAEILGVLI